MGTAADSGRERRTAARRRAEVSSAGVFSHANPHTCRIRHICISRRPHQTMRPGLPTDVVELTAATIQAARVSTLTLPLLLPLEQPLSTTERAVTRGPPNFQEFAWVFRSLAATSRMMLFVTLGNGQDIRIVRFPSSTIVRAREGAHPPSSFLVELEAAGRPHLAGESVDHEGHHNTMHITCLAPSEALPHAR